MPYLRGRFRPRHRNSKLTLQSVEARVPRDIESAFAGMMQKRPDALIMTADRAHQLRQAWIVDFAAKRRLPAMYQLREYVEAGGLMSYGDATIRSRPATTKSLFLRSAEATSSAFL